MTLLETLLLWLAITGTAFSILIIMLCILSLTNKENWSRR